MDCIGGFFTRAKRILVGVDLDGIRRHRSTCAGKLCERGLSEERHGAAGGNHSSDAAEAPARKAAVHEVTNLIVGQVIHKSPSSYGYRKKSSSFGSGRQWGSNSIQQHQQHGN